MVDFECQNIQDVEKEFHAAVDEYLTFCAELGKEPDKEYKGTFNVRISPELHKNLVNFAMRNGDTLNATVEKAIESYVLSRDITNECLWNELIQIKKIRNESIYLSNDRITISGTNIIPFNVNKSLPSGFGKEM